MDREETSERTETSASSGVQMGETTPQSTDSLNGQRTIRYADDAEVNRAMADIFQKHDRLFRELAK